MGSFKILEFGHEQSELEFWDGGRLESFEHSSSCKRDVPHGRRRSEPVSALLFRSSDLLNCSTLSFVADPTNTTDVTPETFDFTTLAPFSAESNYHSQCFISDYNNQTDVEQCWLGDASLPLLDLDTEDSTIVSTMNTWIKNLVSEYSIDGIRIDTAKHVRKDFWPDFVSSAGVFSMGEVRSPILIQDAR